MLWRRTVRNSRAQGMPTPFPKTKEFKRFVAALVISDAAMLIRGIYRVIELGQGWRGYLHTTEPWLYGFDSAMMFICMGVWILAHPGITMGSEFKWTAKKESGDIETS